MTVERVLVIIVLVLGLLFLLDLAGIIDVFQVDRAE